MQKIILVLCLGGFLLLTSQSLAEEFAGSPSQAAYQKGEKLALKVTASVYAQESGYPQKIAVLLWCGETTRDEGVMASFVLSPTISPF